MGVCAGNLPSFIFFVMRMTCLTFQTLSLRICAKQLRALMCKAFLAQFHSSIVVYRLKSWYIIFQKCFKCGMLLYEKVLLDINRIDININIMDYHI